MTKEEIIAKIRKVEALYAGTGFDGEKNAAASALARLNAQLATAPEDKIEFKVSMPDPWKRQLFVALVRRHGLQPYRMARQRRTTVMVRDTPSHMNQILWPEFEELSTLLHQYLDEATHDIISSGVHGDLSDASENPSLPG